MASKTLVRVWWRDIHYWDEWVPEGELGQFVLPTFETTGYIVRRTEGALYLTSTLADGVCGGLWVLPIGCIVDVEPIQEADHAEACAGRNAH